MVVELVRAGDPAAGLVHRGVEDHGDLRADRADEPGRTDPLGDLVLARRPERLAQGVRQLRLVDAVVAAHDDHEQAARLGDDRERLQQRAARDPELARDRLDGRRPRGVDPARRRLRIGQRHRLRLGDRNVHVGGVAGRERHVVLARRTGRHVLVRAGAPHHPDVGLHAVPAQPRAVEDPLVRADVLVVADLQALGVAVDGVGVLHDELARAQDPRARARLVALLRLEVVEDERQVAVGAHELRDVQRDDLLVRHGEDEVGVAAVVQAEQLRSDRLVAAAALPRLGREQHRHEHLLPADRVDLLAHDLHGALVHLPAGGHPRPEAGADLAHEARAHHELVRYRLGVGRGLALGRKQCEGEPIHCGHSLFAGCRGGSRGRCRPAASGPAPLSSPSALVPHAALPAAIPLLPCARAP
jgi:hypothetical protein